MQTCEHIKLVQLSTLYLPVVVRWICCFGVVLFGLGIGVADFYVFVHCGYEMLHC